MISNAPTAQEKFDQAVVYDKYGNSFAGAREYSKLADNPETKQVEAQQKAKAYFLSVFKKDPSAEFLKRFEKHKPPVKKGSEFKIGKGLAFRVVTIKKVISEANVSKVADQAEALLQ